MKSTTGSNLPSLSAGFLEQRDITRHVLRNELYLNSRFVVKLIVSPNWQTYTNENVHFR